MHRARDTMLLTLLAALLLVINSAHGECSNVTFKNYDPMVDQLANPLASKRIHNVANVYVALLTAGQGFGTVRLSRSGITSPSYSSGRVQIYHNSRWGNICDDSQFGLTEAHVICHQLGYTGASSQSRQYTDT